MVSKEFETLLSTMFKSHPWHGVAPLCDDPELVRAFIEMVPNDRVKLELDKAERKLVDVGDAAAAVVRWGGEMATQVRVWRESESSKRPELAADIGRIADALMDMVRGGVDFGEV